jgi:hypothetical protein
MARPQVVNEGDSFQLWRVAVNVLNKQSRGDGVEIQRRGWSCHLYSSWSSAMQQYIIVLEYFGSQCTKLQLGERADFYVLLFGVMCLG